MDQSLQDLAIFSLQDFDNLWNLRKLLDFLPYNCINSIYEFSVLGNEVNANFEFTLLLFYYGRCTIIIIIIHFVFCMYVSCLILSNGQQL